jgi:hypothetical protein
MLENSPLTGYQQQRLWIKCTINKEKYEIHHGLCTKFELNDIMTHCLMVVHKMLDKCCPKPFLFLWLGSGIRS